MQRVNFHGINIEAVIRFFILLGFALFFYTTLRSGKAQLYVHPRIIPYMKFGTGAMGLISLFMVRTIFIPQRRRGNLMPYLLFVLPLLMAFVLPARTMDANTLTASSFMAAQMGKTAEKGGDLLINNGGKTDAGSSGTVNNPKLAGLGNNPSSQMGSPGKPTSSSDVPGTNYSAPMIGNMEPYGGALRLKGNTVIVEEENFARWNDEIYNHMEKYKDKKIQLVGKVFRDQDFKANELAVVRFMMACCAADLQPVGFLCRYDKAEEFKNDAWVRIEGTIRIEEYNGKRIPLLSVEKMEKTQKPADEYIYY